MSDKITTMSNFTTQDITHRPKRTQAENLTKAGVSKINTVNEVSEPVDIPIGVTIEKAIKYYETNAVGELSVLYASTARWLRMFLDKNSN